MEKAMVALSTVASRTLVVVMVAVAALSGMTVVAFVKLGSARLAAAAERVDVTKVLWAPGSMFVVDVQAF